MSPGKGIRSQKWMYFSTLTVTSSNLTMSLAAAWTSPTLSALLADPDSGVGSREATIVNCLLPGSAIASGLLARTVLDKIGRKQANALGGLLFVLSWLVLAVTRQVAWIYVARVLAGLAVGTLYLASGIYVAEVASSEMRQMLFAVSQVFTNLGFLVEYCLGPYVSYLTLVLVSGAPSLVYLACIPFVVESPYYLVSKGYYEEAREVLQTIRGKEDVAAEFKSMQAVLFVFFFVTDNLHYQMDQFLWVPLVALILFFIFSDFGIGPFPSFIGAELFSQKAKGAGTAIALTAGHVFALLSIFLLTGTEFVVSLGVFAVCTAVSTPLIAYFLVDTSGQSLAEIQSRKPVKVQHYEQHL